MDITNDIDLTEIITRCNNCGEAWDEDGSEKCPACGSDDVSTVFSGRDDEEDGE
jgi:rubrerythrin